MPPAKPLPLVTAMASTRSPGAQQVGGRAPGRPRSRWRRRGAARRAGGRARRPALAKWPCSGLVSVEAPPEAPGHLQGRVALASRASSPGPRGRARRAAPSPGRRGSGRPRPGSCRPSRRRSPWSPRLVRSLLSSCRSRGPCARQTLRPVGSRAERSTGSAASAPPGSPSGARQALRTSAVRMPTGARSVDSACRTGNRPDLRRYTIGSGRLPARPAGAAGAVRRQAVWILISMSTPAGRSRRWSESTVLGVCSTMSTQPLVHPHLEVLAAVLVLVRGADHRVAVLLGRQRHRALDLGLGAQHRLDDLLGRLVEDLVVVGLQPDPDLLPGRRP